MLALGLKDGETLGLALAEGLILGLTEGETLGDTEGETEALPTPTSPPSQSSPLIAIFAL